MIKILFSHWIVLSLATMPLQSTWALDGGDAGQTLNASFDSYIENNNSDPNLGSTDSQSLEELWPELKTVLDDMNPQATSTNSEIQAPLEDMLRQIDRSSEITDLMGEGPHIYPSTHEEAQKPEMSQSMEEGNSSAPMTSLKPRPRPEGTALTVYNGPCLDCAPQAENLSYMQCSRSNNYLENELADLKTNGSLAGDLIRGGLRSDSWIKHACVRSSLSSKFSESTSYFRSCSAADSKASTVRKRPCLSENYVTLISNSFDVAIQCLSPMMGETEDEKKREALELLGMFYIESGMHMNAMSSTGAGGFGQMTQSAIRSVNQNELGRIRETLTNQGGICARLSEEYLKKETPMRDDASLNCDRISIKKGNPLTNLIYSIANVMQSKRSLAKNIIDDSSYRSKFSLSHAEEDRLKIALSVWAHNTGIGGMLTPLSSLLNSEYRNKQVTNVDLFLQQMAQAMKDYPHRANRGKSRKKETSSYYKKVAGGVDLLENNAGGGSCLN